MVEGDKVILRLRLSTYGVIVRSAPESRATLGFSARRRCGRWSGSFHIEFTRHRRRLSRCLDSRGEGRRRIGLGGNVVDLFGKSTKIQRRSSSTMINELIVLIK